MKKTLTVVVFNLLLIGFNAKAQDVFNNKIDTLLVNLSKVILNDLKKDSILISMRPWIGFGDAFELEVIFDAKHSFQMTSLHRPDSLRPKYSKWRLANFIKRDMFMHFIYENDEWPFDMFEYFTYKFIQVRDSSMDAVFGEYRFNVNSKGILIIEKNIKIFKGRESIIKKQLSKW
jgi:hypothetical protein